MAQPKLGILAGGGSLPARLVERCRDLGREVFVLAFEGEANPALLTGVPHAWVRMGAAATGFRILKENGVKELVLAGGVRRPTFTSLRPDWRAARFFARIGMRALGDDGLLTAVMRELEAEGFTLVTVASILGGILAEAGIYGRHRPDAQAEVDIAHGFSLAKALGALDIGQAVVVQQGIVLGVEAIEGTDALIGRVGSLKREGPGGVLVKVKKPGQDERADLPTIGPMTVEKAAASGLRGIAVEAGATQILDRDALVAAADRLGLFVLGRQAEETP
jgi:DUF1009 family protein